MSLYDWLQAGGGAALLLMTLVQIAPIKINPWSAVARGIGKTMNKDMMDKLESVETEVKDLKEKHDKLENRMDKDDADACRTRIIRFADELRRGVEHSEEFFNQILDDVSDYENYCLEQGRKCHRGDRQGLSEVHGEKFIFITGGKEHEKH